MNSDETIVVTEIPVTDANPAVIEIITAKPDTQATVTNETDTPAIVEAIQDVIEAITGDDANPDIAGYVIVDAESAEPAIAALSVEEAESENLTAEEAGEVAEISVDSAAEVAPVIDQASTMDAGLYVAGEATDTIEPINTDEVIAQPESVNESATEPTEADLETAEAQAHAQAADEAQARADADIEAGDYRAAAEEREIAENEAWAAVDSDMLHGESSYRLESAADEQAEGKYWEQEEAKHAEAGDYEAAREDASRAADAIGWADYYAGGDDHSGQARAEYEKEDWAVWEQNQADADRQEAVNYAESGNFENAAQYAEYAAEHQEQADTYGQEGEHDAVGAVYDPSSDVAEDTPVDAPDTSYDTYDTTTTDYASDTSYDAGESDY
ncbi:MAG: hypothetical protein AB1757_04110 [Acidobacteriota bacterium]